MVAGDDTRAAMFFIGTPTEGDTQDNKFAGVWHAYVASTLDGGNTWGLTDATPKDPVQIGKICLGGIACKGGRNLLDFNDAVVDKEGRLVGVFADGCLAPKCDEKSASNVSTHSLITIIRQSGGPRLFSEFDKPKSSDLSSTTAADTASATEGKQGSGLFLGAFGLPLLLSLFGFTALRHRKRPD